MGGGAGISVNGAHRVAGDSMTFAMPETAIGFFPDVGATYFLPRLPHRIGAYLAMSAARINLGDVLALGLATAHVPSARFDALIEQFARGQGSCSGDCGREHRAAAVGLVERARGHLAGIRLFQRRSGFSPRLPIPRIGALHLRKTPWRSCARVRRRVSRWRCGRCRSAPISASRAALNVEFRIAAKILRSHDFYEGVRVTLVDKGDTPDPGSRR